MLYTLHELLHYITVQIKWDIYGHFLLTNKETKTWEDEVICPKSQGWKSCNGDKFRYLPTLLTIKLYVAESTKRFLPNF